MSTELKTFKGEFIRSESSFRNWVTKDGSAGPSNGLSEFMGLHT